MSYHYRVGLCYRAGLLVTGAMCAGLGVVVLAGLATNRIPMAQMLPSSVPMPPLAAVLFVLCGMGLLGIGLWYPRVVAVLAAAVVGLGLMAAAQRVLGYKPGMEGWLVRQVACGGGCAHLMAPNTTVCILLAGAALALRRMVPRFRDGYMAVGMMGSVVFTVGIMAVFGYATGFPLHSWSLDSPMSFPSSLACASLGIGVVMSVWRYSEMDETGMPRWLPLLLGSGVLSANLCMLRTLRLSGTLEGRHGLAAVMFLSLGGTLTFLFSAQAWRMRRDAPAVVEPLPAIPGGAVTGDMLSEFFQVYPEPACMIGLDGSLRTCNALWERRFQLSAGEAMHLPLTDWLAPEDRERAGAVLEKLRAGHQTVALDCLHGGAAEGERAYMIFRAVDSGAIVTLAEHAPARPYGAAAVSST